MLTYKDLLKAKDSLDKKDKVFFKSVARYANINIIVDSRMPENSWKIICGKGFYKKILENKPKSIRDMSERKDDAKE